MNQIYLSLGSNIGQRRANLERAVAHLSQCVTSTAVSPLYETFAWGVTDQPDFLNLCVAATTTLSPIDLLIFVKKIESMMGREPTVRWGPRLIDIDIIFYNDLILHDDNLTIPHPRLAERAFVLAPLADLAPDFIHPETNITVVQMLTKVFTTTVRRLYKPCHVV